MMISENIVRYFGNMPLGPTYLNEAAFGLKYISREIDSMASGSRVLEVGSGPGILLYELSKRYPDNEFVGIEPMGSGFAFFSDFQKLIATTSSRMKIHFEGYESFDREEKWDLIFLINVFEHLPSYSHFLEFVNDVLAPAGKCIILCPNYGFPYESHFRIPIIFNKDVTGRLFRNRIEQIEKVQKSEGLWQSLNFVTLNQVKKTASGLPLDVEFNNQINKDLIDRLSTDKEFSRRQSILKIPVLILKWTGLLGLLLRSGSLQNFLPYMYLKITKKV